MADGQERGALVDAACAAGVAAHSQPRHAPASPRSLVRFSVRRLLVLILVIGCGMGWIARVVRSGQAQRRAVAAICQVGGWVVYDTEWDDGQQVSRWHRGGPGGWLITPVSTTSAASSSSICTIAGLIRCWRTSGGSGT